MRIYSDLIPQRAYGFSKKDSHKIEPFYDNPKYWAQRKLDGERFTLQTTTSGGRLFSRCRATVNKIEQNYNVEKSDRVPHLTSKIPKGYEDTIIDGEIMTPDKNVKITSLINCDPELAIERQKKTGNIKYHLFDVLFYKGKDVQKMPLKDRKPLLDEVIDAYNQIGVTEMFSIPYFIGTGKEKRELYLSIIEEGGEGLILKDYDSPYIQDSRTKIWVKAKENITADVVIMGFEPAEKWYAEPGRTGADGKVYPNGKTTKFWDKKWIGGVKYGRYKDGVLTYIGECSGMTDEVREDMTKYPNKYIGKVMEISAQFRFINDGVKGGYRHAAYQKIREDRTAQSCVEEEGSV